MQVVMNDKYTFTAVPMRDGEINGFVMAKNGMVPKSAGFYRTTSPKRAAKIAANNLLDDGLINYDEYVAMIEKIDKGA